jgi:transposase-like protein
MTCPFCDADKPELISQFGSQLLLSQYRCRACGTYFEGLRDSPGGDPPGASPPETNHNHDHN